MNQMFSLAGRRALVTGGASGIGAAVARAFASSGANVWIVDRDAEAGPRVASDIGAQFLLLDITDAGACECVAAEVGSLDVLANVAGIGHVGTILTTSSTDLDKLFSVNVRGMFNLCKAVVPGMLEQHSGSVINMASIAGVIAVRDRLAYTASKFAVVGLTKAMALDHSHTGVRFNCICPGRVETPFVQQMINSYPDPQQAYRDMAATQLNGKMVSPAEVAAAAVYLASDESRMVTGSTLMIDGGWNVGK